MKGMDAVVATAQYATIDDVERLLAETPVEFHANNSDADDEEAIREKLLKFAEATAERPELLTARVVKTAEKIDAEYL